MATVAVESRGRRRERSTMLARRRGITGMDLREWARWLQCLLRLRAPSSYLSQLQAKTQGGGGGRHDVSMLVRNETKGC